MTGGAGFLLVGESCFYYRLGFYELYRVGMNWGISETLKMSKIEEMKRAVNSSQSEWFIS